MILILQTYNTNITNDSRQSMNLNTFLSQCKTNTLVLYIDTFLCLYRQLFNFLDGVVPLARHMAFAFLCWFVSLVYK